MSPTPQLFKIDSEEKQSEVVHEVDFSTLGLQERYDIQEWVAENPSILGDDLLIVTKEFSDFDKTRARLDLLAVDRNGKLVIIEMKRDDSGADAHWQAIKYASYLDRVTPNEIAHMLAIYTSCSEEEAAEIIEEHLGTDDIEILNNDQRIILVSHRFAAEVTSAVLWLNEQTNKDLITCIQLTPYKDVGADALYLLANTIIPVLSAEAYRVQVGGEGNFGLVGKREGNERDQLRREFWLHYNERSDDAHINEGSWSRVHWPAADDMEVFTIIKQRHVAVYVEIPDGQDEDARERMESCRDTISEILVGEEVRLRQYRNQWCKTILKIDTSDRGNWDQMVDWLEERRKVYLNVVGADEENEE